MEANHEIKSFLKTSIQKKRISHAYLFLGEEGTEKKEVALWYEKLLNGGTAHLRTGLLFVEPEKGKREIIVNQIREIRKKLRLTHQGKYKVVIFNPAEAMNSEAQNALLKTLEEPNQRVVLILLANSLQRLKETLLSRCQILKFRLLREKEISDWLSREGFPPEKIKEINFLSRGRVEAVKFWKNHPELIEKKLSDWHAIQALFNKGLAQQLSWVEKTKDASDLRETLAAALQIYHYFLLEKAGVQAKSSFFTSEEKIHSWEKIFRALENIQQTKNFLEETYVNKKLALNQLFINL